MNRRRKCKCHIDQLARHSVHVPRYDMIEIACWKFDCPQAEFHIANLIGKLIESYALTYVNCSDKSLVLKIHNRMKESHIPYEIHSVDAQSEKLLESLYSTHYAHIDKTTVYLQCDIYTYTYLVREGMHVNYAHWGPPDIYCGYNICEDVDTYPKEFREKVMAPSKIVDFVSPSVNAEKTP